MIEVEGLDGLHRKLGAALHPVGDLVKETTEFAYKTAQEKAKPDIHAKGTIAKQIKMSLGAGTIPLSAKVYNPSVIARVIEEGRRPGGKLPSVTNVGRWAAAHGLSAKPFLVARSFQRRGTKGVFFMKGAAEATTKKLPELIGKAAKAIERAFGR